MFTSSTSNNQATNEYQRAMSEYQSYADWLRDMIADPPSRARWTPCAPT